MSGPGESGSIRESLESAVIAAAGTEENPQGAAPEVIAAPETWADTDKQMWEKVADPEARKWLLGREESFNGKLKEAGTAYQPFQELFAPYEERLKESGQTPAQVTKNLLDAQLVLEQKPIDGMMWLVKHYNIPVDQLLAALGGTAPAKEEGDTEDPLADLDPGLKKWLTDQLAPVQEFKKGREDQQTAENLRIKTEADNSVKEFLSAVDDKGAPLYPFLKNPEVGNRISILIKTGQVDIAKAGGISPALKEAYDQACRALPGVREDYLKAITPPVDPVTSERLNRAKKAGVGLKGSGGSLSSPAANGSLRETLKSKMEASNLFTS